MRILNLYAGIGGNRKLWTDVDVTAVEINPEIAKIYQDFFPNDKVIVGDAHKYLLEHYEEFDFIWSSPPCPTHSKLRKQFIGTRCGAKPIYPDMKLYEEIIFLMHHFKGKWVVENVNSYYDPLIKPYEISRHYYWSNFILSKVKTNVAKFTLTNSTNKETDEEQIERLSKELGFDVSNYEGDKRTILRNCVEPKVALEIFNCAYKFKQLTIGGITQPSAVLTENIIGIKRVSNETPNLLTQTSLNSDIKQNFGFCSKATIKKTETFK